jgi:hypothetical protein
VGFWTDITRVGEFEPGMFWMDDRGAAICVYDGRRRSVSLKDVPNAVVAYLWQSVQRSSKQTDQCKRPQYGSFYIEAELTVGALFALVTGSRDIFLSTSIAIDSYMMIFQRWCALIHRFLSVY